MSVLLHFTLADAAVKRNQETTAQVQAAQKENEEVTAQLVQTYYQYVGNIERGASGEKSVLKRILSKDYTPDDLKRRVQAMLRRTDLKLLP